MSELKEIQEAQEQMKLKKAQKSIRTVLSKEPFGLRLEQLTSLSRLSVKYAKEVLKTMDDIDLKGDVYAIKHSYVQSSPIEQVETLPIFQEKPEPIVETKATNYLQNKIVERVLIAIKSHETGISKALLAESLGLSTKQVSNAIIRLRQSHRIEFLNQKYVYFSGEPMIATERSRKRDSYYELVHQYKSRVTGTIIRKAVLSKAVLSKAEIENVLKTVVGLSTIEWTEDGVVMTQVDEVA